MVQGSNSPMAQTILLVGAFDTKGPEYAFVRERILADGLEVLTLNTGVLGSTDLFSVDIEAEQVAAAARKRGHNSPIARWY